MCMLHMLGDTGMKKKEVAGGMSKRFSQVKTKPFISENEKAFFFLPHLLLEKM